MVIYKLIKRFGIAKSTLILSALCVLVSFFLYIIIVFFGGSDVVRPIGVFTSLMVPALIAPPVCIILLRIVLLLYQARSDLFKAQEELEKLVEERTNELRATNEQLIEVSKKIGEAEDIERRRISRELHDTVGQNLTALGISLNILKSKFLQETPEKVCLRVDDALTMVEETTENIRGVISKLRPAVLDDYGLLAAIRSFGEQFSSRTNIDFVLESDKTFPKLNVYIEGALFRITQEALNNVAKHARANRIKVFLKNNVDHVTLTIKDDGIGFDSSKITDVKRFDKWGLTNIMERAMSVGGRCHIESSPGKGTQITVEAAL